MQWSAKTLQEACWKMTHSPSAFKGKNPTALQNPHITSPYSPKRHIPIKVRSAPCRARNSMATNVEAYKKKELILLLICYVYFCLCPPTMAPSRSHTLGITASPWISRVTFTFWLTFIMGGKSDKCAIASLHQMYSLNFSQFLRKRVKIHLYMCMHTHF